MIRRCDLRRPIWVFTVLSCTMLRMTTIFDQIDLMLFAILNRRLSNPEPDADYSHCSKRQF